MTTNAEHSTNQFSSIIVSPPVPSGYSSQLNPVFQHRTECPIRLSRIIRLLEMERLSRFELLYRSHSQNDRPRLRIIRTRQSLVSVYDDCILRPSYQCFRVKRVLLKLRRHNYISNTQVILNMGMHVNCINSWRCVFL